MMATKTISEQDFSEIISLYNLGEYIRFQTFANGAGQTTALLFTTNGKCVLKYYENRPEKHVLFEVKLFDYLLSQKYPIPKIIKNSAGESVSHYKNKPLVILEYIEGEHCKNPNEIFDPQELSEVIKVVAQLHNLTEKYNPDYFQDREEFNPDYCMREYKKLSRNTDKDDRENWLKNELEKLEFPKSLPRGLCHSDLNYGNFLFKNGKVIAVLDFDMSFQTCLIYDVASLIYWWAGSPVKDFNISNAEYIVREYSKHRVLSETEKRHIFDALKLIVLLGISWSDDSDFENEKKKIESLDSIGRDRFFKALEK